jgi:hypothetical protein
VSRRVACEGVPTLYAGRLEVASNHAAIHAPFRRVLPTGDPSAAPGPAGDEDVPKQRKRRELAGLSLDVVMSNLKLPAQGPRTSVSLQRDRRSIFA